MQKKYDITALGEVLIDFTSMGKKTKNNALYEENIGGAPANCACAVSKLGGIAAFIGMTGTDSFGKDIRTVLDECNVDITGMRYTDDFHTTLSFVSLTSQGERSFSFCRNPGADTQLSKDDLDISILEQTKFLQIGSLSLTNEPSATAELYAIEAVKKSGGFISYDPNWRAPLWKDKEKGIAAMKSIFHFADMVKVSDEEITLIFSPEQEVTDKTSELLEKYAQKILDYGVRLVLVTLGSHGVFYKTTEFSGTVTVPDVSVVDTTGAGDSFTGGLLYCLTRKENPFDFNQKELEKKLMFANSVASLCVTQRGAIPALPDLEETEKFFVKYYQKR